MPAPDRKRRLTAFMVAMAVLIATPLAVIASDQFSDVPDSNVFHDDIGWLAGAGITKGCNPPDNTEFCPKDEVTREQMSAFMRRFAQYIDAEDGTPAQADNATRAGDADTLNGNDSAALQTNVLLAQDAQYVPMTADATSEVMDLTLPPGSYLVTGTGIINNNAATPQSVWCALTAGSVGINTGGPIGFRLNSGSNQGERASFSLSLVVQLASTGEASLECTTHAGFAGNVIAPTIHALSVQNASATVLESQSEGATADG